MPGMTYKAVAHELINAQGDTGGMYGKGFSIEIIDFGGQDFVRVNEPMSEVEGVPMLVRRPNLVEWIVDLAKLEGVRYSNSAAVRVAHEVYDELKARQTNG